MIKALLYYFIVLVFISCESNKNATPKKAVPTVIIEDLFTGSGLFPGFYEVDSIVILYYSEKATFRYYTIYNTINKEIINSLQDNVCSLQVSPFPCKKNGTIYSYIKGKLYNTIYFNYTDNCSYLNMYKNGNLYYFPLLDTLKTCLVNLKSISNYPQTNNIIPDPFYIDNSIYKKDQVFEINSLTLFNNN